MHFWLGYVLLKAVIKDKVVSVNNDDDTIPVEPWLHWLNTGLPVEMSMSQWKNICCCSLRKKFSC